MSPSDPGRFEALIRKLFWPFFWLSSVLVLVIGASPALNLWLTGITGFDLMVKLGSGSTVGPRKVAGFQALSVSLFIVVGFLQLVLRKRPGLLARLLALLTMGLLALSQWAWLETVRSDHLALLERVEMPSVLAEKYFSKKNLDIGSMKTFNDFSQAADALRQKAQGELKSRWGFSNELLTPIFDMNLVSHLWNYGNARSPNEPGCVFKNEGTGFRELSYASINVQTYLRTDIGCCDDYAWSLKLLLDYSKVENRLVVIPGHTFNEAKVGSRWIVLDATTNRVFFDSWEFIQTHPFTRTRMLEFPHHNLENNEDYRPRLNMLRATQRNWVLLGGAPVLFYSYTLPEYFSR